MAQHAFIASCAGLSLSEDEKSFFKDSEPWGLILFGRNIQTPDQVKALVASFREMAGQDSHILIDQEGGRVARLRPPYWQNFPPAKVFGDLYSHDPKVALKAVRLETSLMGQELANLGIDIDCAPVLDLFIEGASSVIGDRSYGTIPQSVTCLGRAACNGLMDARVLPVVKHMPGHGRALVDSHVELPVVTASADLLRRTDFVPFSQLSDMPIAMTAHVVYTAWDKKNPATLSSTVIHEVIRREIGFEGLLLSDDIGMNALSGSLEDRSRAAFESGCDIVMYCGGNLNDMRTIAAVAPPVAGAALSRSEKVIEILEKGSHLIDPDEKYRQYTELVNKFSLVS